MQGLQQILSTISQWMIPATIVMIIVWAAYKKVPMYESFVTGAKEGFAITITIIPTPATLLW